MRVVHRKARCAGRDPVLGVLPTERPFCRRDTRMVWLAHAGGTRTRDAGAPNTPLQPTAAREIVRILAVSAMRLRRLMGRPFGVWGAWSTSRFWFAQAAAILERASC